MVWTSTKGIIWTRLDDEALLGGDGYQWLRTVAVTSQGLIAGGGNGAENYAAAIWVLAPAAG